MTTAGTSKRAYHSPLRARRAAETRRQVLEAAAVAFTGGGYAGTTVAQIAEAAGVSVESVYAIGSKAFLLMEAFRLRYTGGSGWVSLLEEPVAHRILDLTDADEALEVLEDFLVTAHSASAELWMAVRSTALVEPQLAKALDELHRLKRESFRITAAWVLRIGIVDVEVAPEDFEMFTAALNLVMSAETYIQMTRDWGLSEAQYRGWVRRTLPTVRP